MATEDLYTKIAKLSLTHFNNLPKTGKPTTEEWTVLSTIVQENCNEITVVALGTGSKCIGSSKMCPNGTILNDSHAEVICRRAFIRYLYKEIDNSYSDVLAFHSDLKKFKLKKGVRFHFFTTHVPCGDAAIFSHQCSDDFGDCIKNETSYKQPESDHEPSMQKRQKISHPDNDINRTGAKCLPNGSKDPLVAGFNYHVTGLVRTKPGRGDPTLSVSCSDKIAIWCHLGIQGGLLSLLLDEPLFLESFTIVKNTPFDTIAASRAFWKRLNRIELLPTHFLDIHQVEECYDFVKCGEKRPGSSSIIYSKNCNLEVSVDGKKQGVTKNNIASKNAVLSISKVSLFNMFLNIVLKYNILDTNKAPLNDLTYGEAKCYSYYSIQKTLLKDKGFNAWVVKDKNLLNFTN